MIRKFRRVDKTIAVPILAVLMTVATVAILLAVLIPYRPFALKSYVVKPDVVCAGGDVTALVTRRFAKDFDRLRLEETWTTVRVPGLDSGLPVKSAEGTLPSEAIQPTEGFDTVPSPLLDEAPVKPGIYEVEIIATAYGQRWGIPVHGTATFTSNTVKVKTCPDKGE